MIWLVTVGYLMAALATMRISFVRLRSNACEGDEEEREDHVAGSVFMGVGWPITIVVFVVAKTIFRPTATEQQLEKKAELERQLRELRREERDPRDTMMMSRSYERRLIERRFGKDN